MLRSLFCTCLTLGLSAWCGWASPPPYPISYQGGFRRTIYTTLTLLSPTCYTYQEWTHAGYSVSDSGCYTLRHQGQRLVLSSSQTVHLTRGNWKRVKGRHVALPEARNSRRLFRHTRAQLNADTIVIKRRRVLYNREFHMYLVKAPQP
jgi:hypothetical protein